MSGPDRNEAGLSRRRFLQASAAGAAVSALSAQAGQAASGESPGIIRVGLVGCGGRGSGAAMQALAADPGVRLTAMADAFSDRLESSLARIAEARPGQVEVPEARRYVGFDAYADLIAGDVDVVLLTTPPGFRPLHLKAAVTAGKHVFCEKPVAVDGPGIRSVLETVEEARRRRLSLVSGFCWRYSEPERETFRRIHKGAIGDVVAVNSIYNTGALWSRERKPEWTDMEYQMRNWLYFSWLSGDHIVEQAVHSIDKMRWAMRDDNPVRATASGGRQVRVGSEFGHIFDHFSVTYEWGDGRLGFHDCRQQDGCSMAVQDRIVGSKGRAFIDGGTRNEIHRRGKSWRWEGEANDMYQTEHDELFASIRSGTPINDGVSMSHSTLMALLGRMAAYTGRTVTWDEALESEESLAPPAYSWDVAVHVPPVAQPGKTRFV